MTMTFGGIVPDAWTSIQAKGGDCQNMSLRPTIRHLVVLKTVVEERSVTKSATLLNSSQPALSRTIKQLEEIVGRQLFDRTTRSVNPTSAGRELYARSVRILSELDAAVASTRDVADGRSGELRVGYMDFAVVGQLPGILRRFTEKNPRVRVDAQWHMTQDQVELLTKGQIDVGFISGAPNIADLEKRELSRERLVGVLPADHRLAGRKAIALAELNGENFVTGDENWFHYTDLLVELCVQQGFVPRISQTSRTRDGILGFVLAGAGVTIYPECILNAPRPGLHFVPIEDIGRPVVISVIWKKNSANPALASFLSETRTDK
ncbi:LysR family transcriptional regulator [Roseovarius spongiae]|uniref:LysR family transcriptional regulator n=1 Tax=Roseovarius spongiae TaxID=2320272 RepID=A0A3A8B3Z4_9RHOB|nr:LysR family transcriptional regulator [Roseovarius spongiae]RKF12674.1 LysR family transcriptional regulator [Roseovarius spongiae]